MTSRGPDLVSRLVQVGGNRPEILEGLIGAGFLKRQAGLRH